MKKAAAVLVACLLVFQLSGCQSLLPRRNSFVSQMGGMNAAGSQTQDYTKGWCYQRLNTKLRSCYSAIYRAVTDNMSRNHSVTITDNETGKKKQYDGLQVNLPYPVSSRGEATQLFNAFTVDNPQFFFIGNTYSYEGVRTSTSDTYGILYLTFSMNAEERQDATVELDKAVGEMLQGTQGLGQFEKELLIHDRLIQNCRYDEKTASLHDPLKGDPTMFTAYGALVRQRAVCEGYSRAMQLLLKRAGMDCTLVTGYNHNGEDHMWNLLTVNGRNYHLDVTWDAVEQHVRHTYFNLSTDEILLTHSIDEDNIGIDTCTATDANYYRYTGRYLTDTDTRVIAVAVACDVRDGKDSVDLRFTPKAFPAAQKLANNSKEMMKAVNAQLSANDGKMWEYTWIQSLEYSTITLVKSKK